MRLFLGFVLLGSLGWGQLNAQPDFKALMVEAQQCEALRLHHNAVGTRLGFITHELLVEGALPNESFDLYLCHAGYVSTLYAECFVEDGVVIEAQTGNMFMPAVGGVRLGEPIYCILQSKDRQVVTATTITVMPIEDENEDGYRLEALLMGIVPEAYEVVGIGFEPGEAVTVISGTDIDLPRSEVKASEDGTVELVIRQPTLLTEGKWTVLMSGSRGKVQVHGCWGDQLSRESKARFDKEFGKMCPNGLGIWFVEQ